MWFIALFIYQTACNTLLCGTKFHEYIKSQLCVFLGIFLLESSSSFSAAAKSLQSCLTVQPHRRQPTRIPRPWDSPGKSTGVGCHFLLQCAKVKSESEVAQLCQTLYNPMDHSLPRLSIHGILQARVLEWVALALSYPHL